MDSCSPNSSSLHKAFLHQGWEQYTYKYIYPIQLFITFMGNILVISVLLGSQVKNRANHLLALLALCDVLVLVLMFPEFLAAILPVFSPNFRIFYIQTKFIFGALVNWFSAAAIWFVLAVSIERLVIIKFPFRSLNNFSNFQSVVLAILVLGGTFLLTSYHYFSWSCTYKIRCNGLLIFPICLPNTDNNLYTQFNMTNTYSDNAQTILRFSAVMNGVLAVIAPVFAVNLLNMALLKLIKKRNSQDIVTNCLQKAPSVQLQQERRMTRTVLAIVTCFSVTQGPSAVLFFYDSLAPRPRSLTFNHLKAVTNSLVLTGKMCNVILFCLTSSIFRRRLLLSLRLWTGGVLSKDRRRALLSTRSLSRSLLTQKTSVAHSPSVRVVPRRSSEMKRIESFNLQLIRRDNTDNQPINQQEKQLNSHKF